MTLTIQIGKLLKKYYNFIWNTLKKLSQLKAQLLETNLKFKKCRHGMQLDI